VSDATTDSGHLADRRRVLASLAAACLVHAAILVALALGVGIGVAARVTPPVTIDLLVSSEPGTDALAASTGSEGAPAGGGAENAGTAFVGPAAGAPAAPMAPAAPTAPAVPAAASGGQGSDSGGFVIPTPRAQPSDSTTAPPTGPSFREAGGKTGVVQGIPSVPSPAPAPSVPPVAQGKGPGAAASSGAGASSVQRSGTGVLVTGSSGSASSGSLDLSQLDKALAGGASTKGAGKGGSTGSSGSTGGPSTGGAGGSGGSGTGAGGSGGSGAGGGAANGGGQGYNISWEGAGSGKGRTLVFSVFPKIPSWVSAQGFTLSVVVSFTVQADGTITGAAIQRSSGYAEVDAPVIDAIRRCRFSPAEGAPPARGTIPYVIRVR